MQSTLYILFCYQDNAKRVPIRLVALPGEIQGPRREAWEDLDEVLEEAHLCRDRIHSGRAGDRTHGEKTHEVSPYFIFVVNYSMQRTP